MTLQTAEDFILSKYALFRKLPKAESLFASAINDIKMRDAQIVARLEETPIILICASCNVEWSLGEKKCECTTSSFKEYVSLEVIEKILQDLRGTTSASSTPDPEPQDECTDPPKPI